MNVTGIAADAVEFGSAVAAAVASGIILLRVVLLSYSSASNIIPVGRFSTLLSRHRNRHLKFENEFFLFILLKICLKQPSPQPTPQPSPQPCNFTIRIYRRRALE